MKTNRRPPEVKSSRRGAVGRDVLRAVRWLLLAGAAGAGLGASAQDIKPRDLADLSLEELMNETVTSVSKKEEKLTDAAAAIFVLSNDDLRRSGTTTVADALRLVPGLQVAALGSADWAVSARGFNLQYANKLLVMIDGRTVYSPLFSGVYWDAQQVFLEDVNRIEVIRGPGAAVWGANAVNGVINILSKSARDTQGGISYAGGGDIRQLLAGVRYGGRTDPDSETWYRVYAAYQSNDDFAPAHDRWDLAKGGFRVDRYTRQDGQLTWQGDAYTGNLAEGTGEQNGFNTLGRWTQTFSARSSYEVQAYLDRSFRNDALARVTLDTADLTFQHSFGVGERHDVLWGFGYRYIQTHLSQSNSPGISIVNENIRLRLFSAFLQDDFTLIPNRLVFTLGTKIEHNDFTGVEVQPSARVAFKPAANQTLWAAVSRAVRTPSETMGKEFITAALGAPVPGPGGGLYVPTLVGNPDLESEVLWAYELGYRIQPTPRVSVDLAAFSNHYDRLNGLLPAAFIAGTPVGTLALKSQNTLHGESYGGEAVLTVAVTDSWRLSASYSLLLMHIQGKPAGDAAAVEDNAPTHQAVLRSSYDFARNAASVDADLRYVDEVTGVPAYLTADLRVSWRPTDKFELALVGQNLLDRSHPEQASIVGAPTVEVPRGFYGKLTWRF